MITTGTFLLFTILSLSIITQFFPFYIE